MDTELFKTLVDNLTELVKANHELTLMMRNNKEDSEKALNAYREELHSAKARCEAYETRVNDLTNRCSRLQEKYDALHDAYDKLVEKHDALAERSLDKSSSARSNVKIKI